MMRRIDIRSILIASLFAASLTVFIFPLIKTLLYFFLDEELELPQNIYLLRCYLPLLLAGIYAGFSIKKSVFINGVFIGIAYSILVDLISIIYLKGMIKFGWMSMIWGPIEDGILCGLISWLTYKTIQIIKKKDNEMFNQRLE